jgi:S1-C subfamily serine protease
VRTLLRSFPYIKGLERNGKIVRKCKIPGVLLITMLILSLSYSVVSSAEMALKDVKKGVVRILTNDGYNYYQGSGFAIGLQGEPVTYIVTNYHVIEDQTEINLYFDESNQYPLEVTDIVFRDNDIALVKLREPLDSLQPLVIETEIIGESGDNILALGFPGISDSIDESFTGYPEDITVTSGIISKIAETNNARFYQIDANISGGNSGGPLINEQGYVIGINSFGILNEDGSMAAGYNGSYLLERLIKALDDNNIPFTTAKDMAKEAVETDQQETTDTPKPTNTNDQMADETPQSSPDDNSDHNLDTPATNEEGNVTNLILMAVALFASLIAVIIIIIVVSISSKKKKNMTPPVIMPVYAPAQPIKKIPQVVGITGYQAGKVFPVQGNVTFGRNPASKIAYPEDYKGISGNHCIIQYDEVNALFLLMDLGSSYGTFLENGQMIQKNSRVALSHGDKFYLASPVELFEVR